MDKLITDAEAAVAEITPGSSLAVGGFGLCGVPSLLVEALLSSGVDELSVVSNNCGIDGAGLGLLLASKQIARVTASYIGENEEFARQYLSGEIEVELVPQGSLAERLRAGGAGIPAFYTPTGVGTLVAEGGLPLHYGADGGVAVTSEPKETREFDGRTYVLERAIRCDFALVRAACADRLGNLVFHEAARNFNPLCAMAGAVTIVEAEEIVEPGELDPDRVHLPSVFVQKVVPVPPGREKPIEKRTMRTPAAGGPVAGGTAGSAKGAA